jgi:phosphoglycerate dehydrogenase-like enzyme
MPRIVVLSPIPKEAINAMVTAPAEVEAYEGDPGPGLIEAVKGADIIIGDYTFRLPIDAGVVEAAGGCKLIQQPSVGYQHIDLEATRRAGIPVANAGTANIIGVAEHTVMFILCLLKKELHFHNRTAAGKWAQEDAFAMGSLELMGKTLGIVGMGNIGMEVAKRAGAFGCRMVYFDVKALPPEVEEELGLERLELEELLRISDIVTLHVPLLPATRYLIDREALAFMKAEAYLLNLSRGEVVDEEALAEALREGRLAGAGIDVFTEEPVNPDNPLLKLDNVILSPHIAGATNESRARIFLATVENINRVLQGEKPINVVNGIEQGAPAEA